MYIGGSQKRPDAPYARPILSQPGNVIAQVSEGNRKDVREAVEAAHKAAPGWGESDHMTHVRCVGVVILVIGVM